MDFQGRPTQLEPLASSSRCINFGSGLPAFWLKLCALVFSVKGGKRVERTAAKVISPVRPLELNASKVFRSQTM